MTYYGMLCVMRRGMTNDDHGLRLHPHGAQPGLLSLSCNCTPRLPVGGENVYVLAVRHTVTTIKRDRTMYTSGITSKHLAIHVSFDAIPHVTADVPF